ncbi:MAG: hypothetical protein WA705_09600 [Candidatus Ozemobacteraceae bacterium]
MTPPLFKAHPLILAFDPVEEQTLRSLLRDIREEIVPGAMFPMYHGLLDGRMVSFGRLPFGNRPDLLLQSLNAFCSAVHPGLLIIAGTAMALNPALPIGTVFISNQTSFDTQSISFGEELLPLALRAVPHDISLRTGNSITLSRFVNNPDDGVAIRKTRPDCETLEMEDFHLASEAKRIGVPLISLRYITDRGCFDDHKRILPEASLVVARLARLLLLRQRREYMLAVIDNPATVDLPYRMVVRSTLGPLPIPQAVSIAQRVVRFFHLNTLLQPNSHLEIILTDHPERADLMLVPSGIAHVAEAPGLWTFLREITSEGGCSRILIAPAILEKVDEIIPPTVEALLAAPERTKTRLETIPTFSPLPSDRHVHLQGLNTISAEAEEGLLAGCMIEEFQDTPPLERWGFECVASDRASIWIYRSGHASANSYFSPSELASSRNDGEIPASVCLIATGLGPAINPAAPGGNSAHLLVLGDEFGGRLISLLDDLSAAPFVATDVFRHEGIALRPVSDTVILSRIDRRPLLTPEGLNELRFNPRTLRQIYSFDYDRFLADYFFSSRRREYASKHSYLLLTSRGCGNGCSICCSGAYQPFTSLSPERIMDLLRSIRDLHGLQPGEYVDVYFLDSYFNRNPRRVITLADRLESEGLKTFFEFYVRHSGLQGFLRETGIVDIDGGPGIVVDEALIEAYRRLGIDEIVMGIDSFTDTSIRLLKTDVHRVAREGVSARPAYTFAQIAAVLSSIEAAGLKSRCFLLLNNPFVDDRDRIETFYNLLMLALDLSGFQIDYTSSDRVNELKPFAGAPLTQVAEAVPGLIRGDRFEFSTALGRIEEVLSFELFGERRVGVASRKRFLASARAIRARLAGFLGEGFDRLPNGSSEARREVAGTISAFLRGEELVRQRLQRAWNEFPEAMSEEERLASHARQLAMRLQTDIPPDADAPSEQTLLFHHILRSISRRG